MKATLPQLLPHLTASIWLLAGSTWRVVRGARGLELLVFYLALTYLGLSAAAVLLVVSQ